MTWKLSAVRRPAAYLMAATLAGAVGGAAATRIAQLIGRPVAGAAPQVAQGNPVQARLAVRRLDIVDEKGVIRLTMGAPTPPPIIDGVQYKRAFPVSGLVLYDEHGGERGGLGVADIPGGAPVLALDHRANDAVGWRVMPDGSVMFVMNARSPEIHKPRLGLKRSASIEAASRIRMTLAPDGSPTIELADALDRPRLRLFTDTAGHGGLQILDAKGAVVRSMSEAAPMQATP